MFFDIAVLRGDGIGPEIIESACTVLRQVEELSSHQFIFSEYLVGGKAIDETGTPLPQETIAGCKSSDSVLLGAVGGPKWDALPKELRPEGALLELRSLMGLYSNIRPAILHPALKSACPLRADLVERGFDMVIVRELIGGMYFGESGRRQGPQGLEAYDTECYSVSEVERIGKVAFELAQKRAGKLVSVDKANVLESSRLWRETMHSLKRDYPQVEYSDMLVDNAAMQLIRDPAQFDVVVTSNMFGDILSDEASQITGSIGLLPSSSLGDTPCGLYEPIHGSAPEIAGMGVANPIATILSAAMMLRYSFDLEREATWIESAVEKALNSGCRTVDILGVSSQEPLSTEEMTGKICSFLPQQAEVHAGQ